MDENEITSLMYAPVIGLYRRELRLPWNQDVNQVAFQILPSVFRKIKSKINPKPTDGDRYRRIVKDKADTPPFKFFVRNILPDNKYMQGRVMTAIHISIVAEQAAVDAATITKS